MCFVGESGFKERAFGWGREAGNPKEIVQHLLGVTCAREAAILLQVFSCPPLSLTAVSWGMTQLGKVVFWKGGITVPRTLQPA